MYAGNVTVPCETAVLPFAINNVSTLGLTGALIYWANFSETQLSVAPVSIKILTAFCYCFTLLPLLLTCVHMRGSLHPLGGQVHCTLCKTGSCWAAHEVLACLEWQAFEVVGCHSGNAHALFQGCGHHGPYPHWGCKGALYLLNLPTEATRP